MALKGLSANKDLIIQKSDKGNSKFNSLNRNNYIKRLNEMLSDSSKFKKLNIKPGKQINCLLQQEGRLTNFLKKNKSVSSYIKSFIQEVHNLVLCMYGLSKIHKL